MEKIKFPWTEENIEKEKIIEVAEPKFNRIKYKTYLRKYLIILKPYFPYFIILLILILVSKLKADTRLTDKPSERRSAVVTLVVSHIPIPKGKPIPQEALDLVEVKVSSLTKTQLLKAFTPEQLSKLSHQIVAKKDIPSQVPIFWSDLQLGIPESVETKKSIKTQIIFSNNSSNPKEASK